MLLPPCLDDDVSEHNPVRALAAFVGPLDLPARGFRHAEEPCGAGQPAYDPGLLRKLSLYGSQPRVRSSRRLEAETHRTLEVIWLCLGAQPSSKTSADCRKDHLAALRATNREFVLLCRELSLLSDIRVALDGTLLKAQAHPGSIHTKARLDKELKRLDERIAAYHRQLDEADAGPEEGTDGGEDPERAAKIEALVEKQNHKKALQERRRESGESQGSAVAPAARRLKKPGKLGGGFHCQSAVDDKHELIVAEDVVQDGNDCGQFEPLMTQAGAVTGNSGLIGLADVGYYSGAKLKGCEARGMEVYVPIPKQPGRKGKGDRFGSEDFRYDPQDDTYVCPAGQRLARSNETALKHHRLYFVYRAAPEGCRGCALSSRCLEKATPRRRVERWEHADWVARHRKQMCTASPLMRGRAALVEHPFGPITRRGGDRACPAARTRQGPRRVQPDGAGLQLQADGERAGRGCVQGALPAKAADSGARCVIAPGRPCCPAIPRSFAASISCLLVRCSQVTALSPPSR